jgi:uncharacterized protein YdeI (YjbR/CyaY-like superfamily)
VIKLVDDYFSQGCGRCSRFQTEDCSTQTWADGLQVLRQLCLGVGLLETAKWGHPCYTHQGRNIAILGAFRADFRITFFNASLLKDAEKILRLKGPNSAVPDMLSFTSVAQVQGLKASIQAYLKEAMALAEKGLKPLKVQVELQLPDELLQALKADLVFSTAFFKLTPGRQKSYVIYLNAAKKSETRVARIAACRERIMAGKGALERL